MYGNYIVLVGQDLSGLGYTICPQTTVCLKIAGGAVYTAVSAFAYKETIILQRFHDHWYHDYIQKYAFALLVTLISRVPLREDTTSFLLVNNESLTVLCESQYI